MSTVIVLAEETPTLNEKITFNIPRQKADLALIEYAKQANVTFMFSFDKAWRNTANRVVGTYTRDEAIELLLKGTGLRPEFDRDGVLTVQSLQQGGDADMTKNNQRGIIASLLAVITMQGDAALAQSEPRALEEIVVTAQRRTENLQEVPISITSFTGAEALVRGLTNFIDMTSNIPNMDLHQGNLSVAQTIRGIGSDSGTVALEPSVATYVDGVYMAHPGTVYFMDFKNVDQLSILKGPQGTLFGRNATAGVVQITTRDPSHETAIQGSLGYGNYRTVNATGYVSTGISEDIAADLTFNHSNRGRGFGYNIITGTEIHKLQYTSFRSKWLYTPSERTTARFIVDYSTLFASEDASQIPDCCTDLAGNPPTRNGVDRYLDSDYNARNEFDPYRKFEDKGVSLQLNHEINDLMSLVSISSYRDRHDFLRWDSDFSERPTNKNGQETPARAITQELQLVSGESSPFEWMLGGFYYNYRVKDTKHHSEGERGLARVPDRSTNSVDNVSTPETESRSVFGQATFDIFEKTRLTAGLRYTDERQGLYNASLEKTSGGIIRTYPDVEEHWDAFTWRVALDYELTPDARVFASVNRGARSGSFAPNNPLTPYVRPEYVTAYEVGFKSEWMDRRLRFNGAVFYYDYTDKAVNITDPVTLTGVYENAASAEVLGTDFEVDYIITDRFKVNGSLGLINGEYSEYINAQAGNGVTGLIILPDASGYDLPFAPKFSAAITVDYNMPLTGGSELRASLTALHKAKACSVVDCTIGIGEYQKINANLGWSSADELYGVRLWAKNLLDERYINRANSGSGGDSILYAYPRTFGVEFEAKLR